MSYFTCDNSIDAGTFGCTLTTDYNWSLCSHAVRTGGNMLSSAVKCSAKTFHPYSGTEGIMG